MSRRHWKKLNINDTSKQDIEDRIEELSNLYDTGWHMDHERPDVGTTLAKIFASQMEENVSRVNDILDRYHTEFVNMLDISLLPAKPASALAVFSLIADTTSGAGVPRGTKLLTTGEDESYVFETDHSIFVTGANIDHICMSDGEKATFTPLYGVYEEPDFEFVEDGDLEEEGAVVAMPSMRTFSLDKLDDFTLFGGGKSLGRDALCWYHPYLFAGEGDDIFVRIEGNERLVREISEGKYRFRYLTKQGLTDIADMELMEDNKTFCIRKDQTDVRIRKRRSLLHMIALESYDTVQTNEMVDDILFSARGEAVPPDSVTGGTNDFPVNLFSPFTDTLNLYSECYVGHDKYFAKEGAKITITFHITIEEHRIAPDREEAAADLRIIKPRPRTQQNEVFTNAYVDETAIEYYNGLGWKRLPLDDDQRALFGRGESRDVTLTFHCPDDWEPTSVGPYEGRCIRFQITKSDNCYMRPAVHHYPRIRDMKIAYSYEDNWLHAVDMEVINGTSRINLSTKAQSGKAFNTFREKLYDQDALYIGLNEAIESGPATMLFSLDDGIRYNGLDVVFEYSGPDEFKQMKIIDYTKGFTRSGIVAFVPPSDWSKKPVEGIKRYWIRLVRAGKDKERGDISSLPRIRDVVLNAATVSNIETRDVEEIYIEEVSPNVTFSLGATGILDADVWVNEMGRYSQDMMRRMKDDRPEDIHLETDTQGAITAFFVRWTEVERFETTKDPRVYQIDRLTNELIFGNGINTWIPRVIDNVAVRFRVRCCDGAGGNVPAQSITQTAGFVQYIGGVTNPIKAYGGSDIEDTENALERGASILSSRNRLVSMDDFKRAIMAYSDTIDQVRAITGLSADGGSDEYAMAFILLMKEFEEGSFAFHRIVGGLKSYLLERCELTVSPNKLILMEPIFVDISVSVWVNVVKLDDSFEIQNLLTECLKEYLDPLSHGNGGGWRIGTIPKKPQILMRLSVLKSRAIVRRSVMVATYTDRDGFHEVGLEELEVTPFMVCRNGKHKVHILY